MLASVKTLTSLGCHGFNPQVTHCEDADTIFTRPRRFFAPIPSLDDPQAAFGNSALSPPQHPTGAALPAGNLERRNRVDMQ